MALSEAPSEPPAVIEDHSHAQACGCAWRPTVMPVDPDVRVSDELR